MLKKIKNFFAEMIYESSGTAFVVLLTMILLSVFNFVNSALLFSNNWFMIPMIALAFVLPFLLFRATRGGKKYLPTIHLELPKKHHIQTILLSFLLLILGGTFLKLIFINERYLEFPLYNAFFAHRNGNLFNDLYLVLGFCIIPPVFEGLVFRGVIVREHDKRGRMAVVLFSSLLFALLGFNFELFLPRLFIGIVLCIVLYATDSIATSIAIHIAYNFFAVFVEPTLVSIKNVSANYELFGFIVLILALLVAILLFKHLEKLYRKYSHDRFGESFVKSTPRERTFWHLVELLTSIPAFACYVLFIFVSLITK